MAVVGIQKSLALALTAALLWPLSKERQERGRGRRGAREEQGRGKGGAGEGQGRGRGGAGEGQGRVQLGSASQCQASWLAFWLSSRNLLNSVTVIPTWGSLANWLNRSSSCKQMQRGSHDIT